MLYSVATTVALFPSTVPFKLVTNHLRTKQTRSCQMRRKLHLSAYIQTVSQKSNTTLRIHYGVTLFFSWDREAGQSRWEDELSELGDNTGETPLTPRVLFHYYYCCKNVLLYSIVANSLNLYSVLLWPSLVVRQGVNFRTCVRSHLSHIISLINNVAYQSLICLIKLTASSQMKTCMRSFQTLRSVLGHSKLKMVSHLFSFLFM